MENDTPAGGCHQPVPITHQPETGEGYPPPGALQAGVDTGASVCPRELEYLNRVQQLFVHQKFEYPGAFLNCEIKNKYLVKNASGQKVYAAVEDTNRCSRICCGSYRPFHLQIKDNFGHEVIHLSRDLKCSACCFPCCLQKLEVFSPPKQLVGVVVQEWSFLTPQFRVENEKGEAVFKIEGPCCTFSICGNVDFQVISTNGEEVGKISKKWSGCYTETYSDVDNFGIIFPDDADFKMKATLLGALFLIDYMYFESVGDYESDFSIL